MQCCHLSASKAALNKKQTNIMGSLHGTRIQPEVIHIQPYEAEERIQRKDDVIHLVMVEATLQVLPITCMCIIEQRLYSNCP